ncbi:MAG: two-component regulator propeller domain-containing protein [Akkermansiaceae bacterium]
MTFHIGIQRSILRAARILLLAVFSSTYLKAASATEPSKFVVTRWEMRDGLPLNKVRAIIQTQDGYLWVGTFNGLARFDGVRFKTFDAANSPGLRNNAIESLCEDRQGRLWIGDNLGGLTVLENGRFRAVDLHGKMASKPILRLAAAADGTVWVMNESGAIQPVRDGIAGDLLPVVGLPIALARDLDGEVWAGIGGQLCRLDPESGAIPLQTGPEVNTSWQAIFPAQSGGLWILDDGWLRCWRDGKWVADRGKSHWGTFLIPAFLENRRGQIFGGSFKQGVRMLDKDGRTEQLDEEHGLSHNWAYALCEDREGNIWVGTGNGGLNVLYPRRVTMVNAPDMWQSSAVLTVAPRAAGGLWIGTEGAGIYRLSNDKQFTNESSSDTFWQSIINSVMEDGSGRLWVGTWGSGLRALEDGQFHDQAGWTEEQKVVLTVFKASSGDIWAGTKGGASRLRDGRWEWIEQPGTLGHDAVRCFAEHADGSIWIGLDGGGVCRMQQDEITRFDVSDGLASNYVRTMYSDPNGSLWVGTRGGLSRFKDGKFTKITIQNGLPSNVICQILDDQNGHYWMSSFGGLFRVPKKELEDCADATVDLVNCLVCDASGGLATLEMSEQGQPAGCRTADGRLWFATGRGLAMVEPQEIFPNHLLPPVIIEEMLVDGKELPLPTAPGKFQGASSPPPMSGKQNKLVIPPGGRQFEFRYTGLSLVNPSRVTFKYRLKGLHDDWLDGGRQRSVSYTQLPPGDYAFQVTARNADGVWNHAGADLALRVEPHFWQTRWFKLISRTSGAALLSFAVFTLVRRRARQKLQVLRRQRAIDGERARIARDIHDDIGSTLTRLVMLGESAHGGQDEPSQLAEDLSEICQTGRELTLQLSEIVWAVNPEHDTLDSFAAYVSKYAHDYLAACGVRCRLDIPIAFPDTALESPVRHHVFLAFKEALNNAVKHAHPNSVQVSLAVTLKDFTLAVTDDGCGLPAGLSSAGGHGLSNMRTRMEEVGGRFEIQSAPSSGTRLLLIVPLAPITRGKSHGIR